MDEKEEQEYRLHVLIVEKRPENQSGADKTWVEETVRASEKHFRRAVLVG